MRVISEKKKGFFDFIFEGLDWEQKSNNYVTCKRVNEAEDKIVIKVGENQIYKTMYGYALILDVNHVVYLKDWQVSDNYFGKEVVLDKKYFNLKKTTKDLSCDFAENEELLKFENLVKIAKEQDSLINEDGLKLNAVRWEI